MGAVFGSSKRRKRDSVPSRYRGSGFRRPWSAPPARPQPGDLQGFSELRECSLRTSLLANLGGIRRRCLRCAVLCRTRSEMTTEKDQDLLDLQTTDSFRLYLDEVGRHPLLTKEDEIELSQA